MQSDSPARENISPLPSGIREARLLKGCPVSVNLDLDVHRSYSLDQRLRELAHLYYGVPRSTRDDTAVFAFDFDGVPAFLDAVFSHYPVSGQHITTLSQGPSQVSLRFRRP